MFCSQCGSENKIHLKFCSNCGNRIELSDDKLKKDVIGDNELPKTLMNNHREELEDNNAIESDGTPSQELIDDYADQEIYFNKKRLIYIISGVAIIGLALYLIQDKQNPITNIHENRESETTEAIIDEYNPALLFVNQERAHFHDQPKENTKQNTYCILGDVVTVKETSGDWVLVTFTGDNTTTKGWMLRSDLTEEMPTIKLESGIATSLVDELRVRVKPGLNQEVVGKMNSGETAVFLEEKTEFLTTVSIRNTDYTEPWYYIRLDNGILGWVHGCCITITSNYEYDQPSANENEMNLKDNSQSNFQIDENSVKNENEVNLSNVGIWIGHSKHTSKPNSCIIILSDHTWRSTIEGLEGNIAYAAGSWYGDAEDFVLENELNTSVSMDGRISEDGKTLYIRFQGFVDVIKLERLTEEEKKNEVRRPY